MSIKKIKQIKIGPAVYNVKLKKKDNVPGGGGHFHWDKPFEIKISKSLNRQNQLIFLMHEITHAILQQWNISLKEAAEESICDIMANAIIMIIKENPDLLEVIKEI